ncbi:MAG: hypothetical protein KDB67_01210 [Gordonia sp.]|jgi:hypothetical protein|uniref:hypothetical protein n=1 Tax=Gordonia sp. (in: high G+C Gram-positive bacteria) TaxID=84139 RepID=UPI001D45FA3B|nr:hypothetical protein [Gordonia sp. (in: high G+C Gram-positive bacteria)]MCB1293295.1 hypothetical protein [Gordonia sp. (in: high G+C Gram-positive bacteria)]
MLPRIDHRDDRIGFWWCSPDGVRTPLAELIALPGAEPDRWLPTHLEAFDDVLIDIAERFGQILGGGRRPTGDEYDVLAQAYAVIDHTTVEYVDALHAADMRPDIRAGEILGTAALMGIRLREVIGLCGPAPFDGSLDTPSPGVVSGHAGLHWVDDHPWRGARWLIVTEDGRRLPAALAMLLNDSSGVDKQSCIDEHRAALERVTDAATDPAAAPEVAGGALDWLIFDWVMAHRDGPDSAAVVIPSGRRADAAALVAGISRSVRVRARYDPALADLRTPTG